jgi:hypothetical protein
MKISRFLRTGRFIGKNASSAAATRGEYCYFVNHGCDFSLTDFPREIFRRRKRV